MRYPYRILLPMLFCSSSIFTIAQVNLSEGLVVHYPFSGDAADSSGHGHDGVLVGGVLVPGKDGTPNSAFRFNGYSDHMDVPNDSSFTSPQYSIAAVVQPLGFYTGYCQGNVILWKGVDVSPGHYGLIFSDGPYQTNGCASLDTLHQNFYNDHGFALTQSDTPFVLTHTWYCVLSTFDGDSLRFYVDGIKRYTLARPALGENTSGLSIGWNTMSSSYRYWFHGDMDDIRVYNRVLNGAEIEQLCKTHGDVSMDLMFENERMILYPNPNSGMFSISVPERAGFVDVMDITGRQLFTRPVGTSGKLDVRLDAAGAYLIAITTKGGRKVYRVVVE